MHIAKGKPSPNATKIWLTKSGGCIVANNGSKIPSRELNELLEFISAQFFLICSGVFPFPLPEIKKRKI